MNGSLFACDIDNTLIYSRKHPHEGWPCVEWIHEREQAYMSELTAALLPRVQAVTTMVPVTSRSIEQYRRLRLPGTFDLALTANGADLLVAGVPDPLWRARTMEQIAPWRDDILRCRDALERSDRYIRCRVVDEAYLFVYCAEHVSPETEAEVLGGTTRLNVIASGKKIYLLPPPLNKGEALERLREKTGPTLCVAAGDSVMDLPMLRRADFAIATPGLDQGLLGKARICPKGQLFSEFVLQTVIQRFGAET